MSELPRGFREQAYLFMDEKIDTWNNSLGRLCESPIEAAFAVAFMVSAWEYRGATWWVEPAQPMDEKYPDYTELLLLPQREVLTYRVDFLVFPYPVAGKKGVVVECDGHDFHERTKEQAARDRKKDRDLQAAGYRVLRFTGSEIYRDAFKCAKEALSASWQVNKP